MKTPILGGSYVARSINAADSRMVNLFPETVPEGGKEQGFLTRAPGLRLLATYGTGPVRGLWSFGGYGYVVSGYEVYKIDSNYAGVVIGMVSNIGPVSMTDNGTQLFIACNGPSYIYNSNTFAFGQITDPDFTGAVTVAFLDGYFVYNEPNSQRLWITSLLDGTSIDPLDFASAEGSPDILISLIVDHREVWLFGTNTVEVWYDSGNALFPLERIQGAFNEIGCAAPYSVAKLDNSLFWLGADARGIGIVYRANGYSGTRISTHSIEYHISTYGYIGDAIAYTYQQEGHSFYVLTFPTANATWVYDVATQLWHERAGLINGGFIRHRSNCQMAFNSKVIVGDYVDGRIYAFDQNKYSDDDAEQKWLRSWRAIPPGGNDLKRTAHHSLQLDAEAGVGQGGIPDLSAFDYISTENDALLITEDDLFLVTQFSISSFTNPQVTNPQVMLRWSDNAGYTWSNEHWRSMGSIGEYSTRIIWRRLGMTTKLRDRVYEISGTDPVKLTIMGAELHASATNA
jgi:hypothetical protein